LGDIEWNIVVPDVPNYEKFPNWPFSKKRPSIRSGDGYKNYNFNGGGSHTFDSGEYEKNKQKYVDKLNRKYDTNVSVKEVDAWLRDVDVWADGFESVMEDWGEEFGKEIEIWAEQFEHNMDNYSKEVHKDEHGNKAIIIKGQKGHKTFHSKAKKKIIIRLPKGTKTDINVRHGEVKMADVYNIKATLNYATFIANSIDGGNSLINASYAPVSVNKWVDGDLRVKYVDDCKLNTVQNINLQANSSDVSINTISDKAYLSGSFGNLYIYNVSNDFEIVDIVLENTDAKIKIPNTAFSFYFNGKKSPFSAPSSLAISKNVNGGRVVLDGYYKADGSAKKFNINASYSNVNLQK